MRDVARPSGPRGIQSIELGYRILTAIQQGPDAVALKTISTRAGMSPSAVHNYLASFVRTGMVSADTRGQYRLGPSLAALGLAAARQVDHFELIRGKAVALSESTGLGVAGLISSIFCSEWRNCFSSESDNPDTDWMWSSMPASGTGTAVHAFMDLLAQWGRAARHCAVATCDATRC